MDDCGENTKTAYGRAEQHEFESTDKHGEGRVFNVPPLEMLRVIERLELVAMKAVLTIYQKVQKEDCNAASDEKAEPPACLRFGGIACYAVCLVEVRRGGNSSTEANVHIPMLHQERAQITWILRANVEV